MITSPLTFARSREARQILREVLVRCLIFAPRIDGAARYYEFTGQATLSGLLAGVVTSDMMVTPAGHNAGVEFTRVGEAVA